MRCKHASRYKSASVFQSAPDLLASGNHLRSSPACCPVIYKVIGAAGRELPPQDTSKPPRILRSPRA
eukprot:1677040-Prymnesium_polylepis.1